MNIEILDEYTLWHDFKIKKIIYFMIDMSKNLIVHFS